MKRKSTTRSQRRTGQQQQQKQGLVDPRDQTDALSNPLLDTQPRRASAPIRQRGENEKRSGSRPPQPDRRGGRKGKGTL